MSNIAEWLRSIFTPCPHQWEKVDTLRDRPENPTATKLIILCLRCGETKEVLFRAPTGVGCPPHRWADIGKTSVHRENDGKKIGDVPIAVLITQKCDRCGEIRAIKLTSSGVET